MRESLYSILWIKNASVKTVYFENRINGAAAVADTIYQESGGSGHVAIVVGCGHFDGSTAGFRTQDRIAREDTELRPRYSEMIPALHFGPGQLGYLQIVEQSPGGRHSKAILPRTVIFDMSTFKGSTFTIYRPSLKVPSRRSQDTPRCPTFHEARRWTEVRGLPLAPSEPSMMRKRLSPAERGHELDGYTMPSSDVALHTPRHRHATVSNHRRPYPVPFKRPTQRAISEQRRRQIRRQSSFDRVIKALLSFF